MVYPDTISVYHKLRARPEDQPSPSFFTLDCIVLSHQHRRPAARLEEDIVVYDYNAKQKTGMPPFMLQMLQKTYDMQEAEALKARVRICELTAAVEGLEKNTWDREDAVEDMGTAAEA
jgi:hypothetical protein